MNLSDCWAAERAPLSLVDFKLYHYPELRDSGAFRYNLALDYSSKPF